MSTDTVLSIAAIVMSVLSLLITGLSVRADRQWRAEREQRARRLREWNRDA